MQLTSRGIDWIRYKVVHVDGDQEDLEEYEVQQAHSHFLREMERLKETPASIYPAVPEPTEDAMQVEGKVADRRKRRKPERFFACAASSKRSATGQHANLNVVNLADNTDEVEWLKQLYSSFSGHRPRGPCASKVSWLRERVAELHEATQQTWSTEDTRKASSVHQYVPPLATDIKEEQGLTLHDIEHSAASQHHMEQTPALASQIAGPRKIQAGDKILYKFHMNELEPDEREQWFIGTVKRTGKEIVRILPPRPIPCIARMTVVDNFSFCAGGCVLAGAQLVDR